MPSTVTWSSCMHSSSAACVFGDARLTSSTSSRLVKTGPRRNSNSFRRWLNTFTPVTSDGSRSGVNCRRENEQSIERESAFASIVFPTPGKSSMIRCPSPTRQSTQRRRVSSGAWITRATFAAIAASSSAAPDAGRGSLRASIKHPFDLVQHHGRNLRLRRAGDVAASAGREDHDLVLVAVEADVLARHVVVDEQVEVLSLQLLGRAREAVPARLGGEA